MVCWLALSQLSSFRTGLLGDKLTSVQMRVTRGCCVIRQAWGNRLEVFSLQKEKGREDMLITVASKLALLGFAPESQTQD